MRDIDSYIKWIRLIKASQYSAYSINVLQTEAWRTCIQKVMNFYKKIKGE